MVNRKCIPVVEVGVVEVGVVEVVGIIVIFVSLMILQYGWLQQKFITSLKSYTLAQSNVVCMHWEIQPRTLPLRSQYIWHVCSGLFASTTQWVTVGPSISVWKHVRFLLSQPWIKQTHGYTCTRITTWIKMIMWIISIIIMSSVNYEL